ncbi:unnamed protein product [Coregonus sp. 'balchen']|nr:unnamed protein product [Coregonus sp. 'balchen']
MDRSPLSPPPCGPDLTPKEQHFHGLMRLPYHQSVNSDSLDLEQEVDPLNVDHFSCTPLMWACALGHQATAEVLYGWNSQALGIPDSLGRLPLSVARSRGHTSLAHTLEDLHTHRPDTHTPTQGEQRTTPTPQLPPSPLSTSPDTAYSSGSVPLYNPPDPMDTSPSSPSLSLSSLSPLSPSSLPLSPPSPSLSLPLPLPVWGEACGGCEAGDSSLNAGPRDSLFLMDYEPASPPSPPGPPHAPPPPCRSHTHTLEEQVDMATLAEQIIEATPERIKLEELCTPPSHLSSLQRLRPPSSVAWAEFLNASANGRMERDFALLTLTDSEQRELYEAARIIQNAFRRYKGRRLKEQQDMAAAVIQRCYRKYKQYALYKRMTQAAILIQSKFRSYYEQKKFQQSRRAAVLIQQYYRSYKEGSFLTKKQDQAARKIMRFLRRCRHRDEERETPTTVYPSGTLPDTHHRLPIRHPARHPPPFTHQAPCQPPSGTLPDTHHRLPIRHPASPHQAPCQPPSGTLPDTHHRLPIRHPASPHQAPCQTPTTVYPSGTLPAQGK